MLRSVLRASVLVLIEIREARYLKSVEDADGIPQEGFEALSDDLVYQGLHALAHNLRDNPEGEASEDDIRIYKAYKHLVIWQYLAGRVAPYSPFLFDLL